MKGIYTYIGIALALAIIGWYVLIYKPARDRREIFGK